MNQANYISPSTSAHCRESAENHEDAINRLETFYDIFGLNTTMYVPQRDSLSVDEAEYNTIRTFCKNFRSTFQNILDFKFYSDFLRSSISHRSTCPWVFVENYDEDRLPRVISEAQCVCNRCFQRTRTDNSDVRYVPKLGRCKQVMTSVMTIRRHCNRETGLYEYIAKAERMSVGCTCTSPYNIWFLKCEGNLSIVYPQEMRINIDKYSLLNL